MGLTSSPGFRLAKEEAVPRISVIVDGVRHEHDIESRLLLVHYLRDHARKVGTVVSCDTSNWLVRSYSTARA